VLDASDERLAHYPGLYEWWRQAEAVWIKHRLKSTKLSLREQLDYRKKLSDQLPVIAETYRVVYNASGMNLAAAVVHDASIIEKSLYWCSSNSQSEARYIQAILNAEMLTKRLRPLQARGEHNPRHYDKYVWQVPIPVFDPSNELHVQLAALAERAEAIAAGVPLTPGRKFETLRRLVRQAIAGSDVGRQLEEAVAVLLPEK